MRIPELKAMAAGMGIKGLSGKRKADIIAAIQAGGGGQVSAKQPTKRQDQDRAVDNESNENKGGEGRDEARGGQQDGQGQKDGNRDGQNHYESRSQARRARRNRARQAQREQENQDNGSRDGGHDGGHDGGPNDNGGRNNGGNGGNNGHGDGNHGKGRRRERRRRGRRNRDGNNNQNNQNNGNNQQGGRNQNPEDLEPVAGILDIVDNNVAFVRTTGYHPSEKDVYVPNQLIKRCGLRSGDAVTGRISASGAQVRGRGRNRQKFSNLAHVETVNGLSVEEARQRPDFAKLTPLYPNQRLRLETEQKVLTTRVIDLIMPIGKGQRALIVSPPKAGKTTILQNVANAISTNNPECHLMVVLVDERPEEVTDMQRSVNGEVIASTFDRPPSEHTAVAELAVERAKRLVEQGKDVVILLDSITRLGRAYNNSSPASGRILSGGVDSNALYPPKRFLGAARNIEHGGSLTIIATAMVETGSAGDTVIFEEFKGTGNAELKLDRKISERRVFPAVDVGPSGTRKDELLLAPEEARLVHKLRRILAALDNQAAIDLLIKQLKKTKSNGEFLMQVASSAPMAADKDVEDYL
ncbi:transcription termination factor Rho [Corynebacterium frankenforstense]